MYRSKDTIWYKQDRLKLEVCPYVDGSIIDVTKYTLFAELYVDDPSININTANNTLHYEVSVDSLGNNVFLITAEPENLSTLMSGKLVLIVKYTDINNNTMTNKIELSCLE